MAIDMKKMREKYSALQNRGQGGSSQFWKPSEGNQTIRIVPTEDGDPFKSFSFHYGVGKESGFLCPKHNYGDDCAVCTFVRGLYQEGDEESRAMARQLGVKSRFFSPVLVRGEEESGVRLWGFSKTVYETLLGLVLNPDYGDITDTETGIDLDISYGKQPGGQFPLTKVTPKRRESTLCNEKLSEEQCAQLLSNIPDFNSLFERKSSTDVQGFLDAHLASDSPEDFSSEVTKYAGATSGANRVDNALDELMGV
jgi:hypothetical protein